ncbi:MAG: GNAT family N-acetyltransferase [Deltaproteobacteria bacterium]|jgi:predicted N-acetyltransferase YhbS|nr:GNAT family N-acetyltransferase [Deltaproteobacteria bacterium]
MNFVIRAGTQKDAGECGAICFEAFATVMPRHGFPRLVLSPEAVKENFSDRLSHPGYHVLVAERDGRLLGSVVIDERSLIAGVGPLTIDPAVQDRKIGRRLMQAVFERERERRCPGMRLCQDAYQNRSLALYAKLGFEVREPLVVLQGAPPGLKLPGYTVRFAGIEDVDACNALCRRVFGYDRGDELRDAVEAGTATLVERDNRCSGYATGVGYSGHAAGETSADLKALIGAAAQVSGLGFLLPSRNGELLRWCLGEGFRIVKIMTLMSAGLYHSPQDAFLPSISG